MSEAFTETAKIALFGANSTGKTLQIRSLIETFGAENVGIVSCEDGLKVIRSSVRPEQVKECNSIGEMREAELRADLTGHELTDQARSGYVEALDVLWHAMTSAEQDEAESRLMKRAS